LPEAGKAEWRRVVPILAASGTLGELARRGLQDYCLCVARLDEAEGDISERGLLVAGDRGRVKNPACQMAREYREALQRWIGILGLGPVTTGGKPKDAPEAAPDEQKAFAAYMKGPGGSNGGGQGGMP